jgi:hypothetical protein
VNHFHQSNPLFLKCCPIKYSIVFEILGEFEMPDIDLIIEKEKFLTPGFINIYKKIEAAGISLERDRAGNFREVMVRDFRNNWITMFFNIMAVLSETSGLVLGKPAKMPVLNTGDL